VGTNAYGVMHFEGEPLGYLLRNNSFSGEAVRTILEDTNIDPWFTTNKRLT
jgi:hypothetical protein